MRLNSASPEVGDQFLELGQEPLEDEREAHDPRPLGFDAR
jgi:hypothetical protein